MVPALSRADGLVTTLPLAEIQGISSGARSVRISDQVQEGPMNSRVIGKLRMECGGHGLALAHSDRVVAFCRDDFHSEPRRSILGARMNTISSGELPNLPSRIELSIWRP